MPTLRTAIPLLIATVIVTLGGCAVATAEAGDPLAGTVWAGTDSLDRETSLLFQPDGTVRVTYDGDTFDDELDTWQLTGANLEMDIYQGSAAGTATYIGELDGDNLALSATTDASNERYTVTLTRQP